MDDALYRGCAVISPEFYIAPVPGQWRRNLDVATQMYLPPPSEAVNIVRALEEITGKLVGHVTAPYGGQCDRYIPIHNVDQISPDAKLVLELMGGDIEEGSLFFNWGAENEVRFADILSLLFPDPGMSRDFQGVLRELRMMECRGISMPDLEGIYDGGIATPVYTREAVPVTTAEGIKKYPLVSLPLNQESPLTSEYLVPFKRAANVLMVLHGSKRIQFGDAMDFVNQLERICEKLGMPKVDSGEFTLPGRT